MKRYTNKLLWIETLKNSAPCLIGLFLWLGIVITGVQSIRTEFVGSSFYPVLVMIWMIVAVTLSKIIPMPITTYNEREETQ